MDRLGCSKEIVVVMRGLIAGAFVSGGLAIAVFGADAKPATVAEAAKVLDLSKLPVVEGATEFGYRTLAWLSYKAPADVKTAYGFHLKQLTGDGWKEQPNSQVMNESASAALQRDGYTISLSASASGEEKSCQVMIVNHGNVDLAKVAAPPKSKPLYAFPSVAAHITEVPLEETTETVKKLLLDAGWVPYGDSPGLWSFKKNAVLLKAGVSTAPAQDNKTVVTYSSELMSADLPAPELAEGIDYYDQLMRLQFETKQPANEVVAFYRDALKKLGWEPATDKPIEDDGTLSMYFNSKPQGRLSLEVVDGDDKRRVELKRQTPEQLAEIDRLIAEEKKKPKTEPTPEPKPETPVVKLKLPAGAKDVETEEDSIKFVVAAGKAKAAAEAFRKTLKAAGWQEDVASLEKAGGSVSLSKDDASITIVYIDIGFSPADVSVTGFRVNLAKE
jgi:hypothetical protein